MKDLHEDNMFGSIRERLGRYEEAPSDELWGKIAASQKKRGVPLWLYSGVGVVAIVAGFLFLTHDAKREEVAIKENKTEKEIPRAEKSEPIKNEPVIETPTKTKSIVVAKKSIALNQEPTNVIVPQSQITDHQSQIKETKRDSSTFSSPILSKKDSSSKSEVVPPYKRPKSKFQLYFSATPSLSFQKMIPSGDDNIIVQGLANRSPFSIKRFGFAIDVGTQYELNKYFGFYGGLSFYHQKQQLTYTYYDKDASVTRAGDSWTFLIDRPVHTKTFDYTMTNLGAQAGALVTLKGDKLKNKFGAGINYTQSLNSSASYLAYQVFFRSEIRINERFSWYVQPMFTYSFIAKEKLDEPFTLKPYRTGITSGVLYRFK